MTATQTSLAIAPAGPRPGPRGDHRMYSLAAERRAVEEGHNARGQPDGSVLVRSESSPGSYRVWIRDVRDGELRFGCTCLSGQHRRALAVPCKHAALTGRRLERERLADWADGGWRLRPRAQVLGARLLLAGTAATAGTHAAGTRAGTHAAGTRAGTHAAGTRAGTHAAGTRAGTHAAGTRAGTHAAGTRAGTHAAGTRAGTHAAGTRAGTHAAGTRAGTH